ncbi:MAG TPA: hypothetical protein VIG66_02725 [Noviherbaspirillum sp.]
MSFTGPDPLSIERVVHTYLLAKDGNRPHLMRHAFAGHAQLQMQVRSENIAFPAASNGLAEISEVLVRRFGQTYENVYTFCLQRPAASSRTFSCDWFVGMSDKASGAVRVGCGRYDWTFSESAPHLAEHLLITIDVMEILAPENLVSVSTWLAGLPYPWCSYEQMASSAPAIGELEPILTCLRLRC